MASAISILILLDVFSAMPGTLPQIGSGSNGRPKHRIIPVAGDLLILEHKTMIHFPPFLHNFHTVFRYTQQRNERCFTAGLCRHR
jgi:hypothetical protein